MFHDQLIIIKMRDEQKTAVIVYYGVDRDVCARESASVCCCVPYCVSGASHFRSFHDHDFWNALRRDAPVDPCVARQTASASEMAGVCGAIADGGRGRRASSSSAPGPTTPSPFPAPAPSPAPVPQEHPEALLLLVLLLVLVTGSDRAPEMEMESARAMKRSPTWTDGRGAAPAPPPVQPDAVQDGSRAELLAPVSSSVASACPVRDLNYID